MARITLNREVRYSGVGLHSGTDVAVTLRPAASGEGYGFEFDGKRYRIETAAHSGDGRGTILDFEGHKVMTVEHLLAAVRGAGIDDVTICPSGIETPLLDGSALGYSRGIAEAGTCEQPGEPDTYYVETPMYVTSEDEQKICAALPSDRLRFTYVIEYPASTAIGTQTATVEPTSANFIEELAGCRTFCLYEEVEQMRKLGLGLGGTVETALVVKDREILTPGGLRRPDEFVRHKILDMMGDLCLLGRPVVGHFLAIRAGHAMHQKLADRIIRSFLR